MSGSENESPPNLLNAADEILEPHAREWSGR